jgi:hypothetical protein
MGVSRIATLMGYVGGQGFPIAAAGSGYTNGTWVMAANCGTQATGGIQAFMDLTVVGGALVNAYPSSITKAMGLGLPGPCIVSPNFGFTASIAPGTGTGSNGAPVGSGLLTVTIGGSLPIWPGEVIQTTAVPGTSYTITGFSSMGPGTGGTGKYVVNTSTTVASHTFSAGSPTGSGASVAALLAPSDGVGGIATLGTDMNMTGDLLYDNSGFPGNPLNPFFANGFGGYFEPGLPVMPWGNYLGAAVGG